LYGYLRSLFLECLCRGVQANLRGQIEREKALGEAEGRAKEARENEDINRRAALLKYQEEVCTCVSMPTVRKSKRRLGQA